MTAAPAVPFAALVTGAGGQLGTDLVRLAEGPVTPLRRADLDVTDRAAVVDAVAGWAAAARADGARRVVVLNAAAYNAVDAAETDEAAAFAGNALGPRHLAEACVAAGVRLVHVSTDYVFAGDATRPYAEDAPTAPRSAYGRTKLAGEWAVLAALPAALVVRTAWVYGAAGGNFVKTMVRLERERDTVLVVDDQRGAPTWSRDLAAGLLALAGSDVAGGVYHCTGAGETTWHGLTQAIFEELGADPARVRPTTTEAFPRPARRPAYSVLSDARWCAAGLPPMPHWRAALATAFAEVGRDLRDAPVG